jgi:hypothetical protein
MQYNVAFITYCLVEKKRIGTSSHVKTRGDFSCHAKPMTSSSSLHRELDAFSGLPLELVFHFASLYTKLPPLGKKCAPLPNEIFKPQRGPSFNRSYLQELHGPDPATSYKRKAHLSDSSSSFLACPNVAYSEERVQRGHQCPTQV